MCRCLCCYKELLPTEVDYHATCAKKWFGKAGIPQMPYAHASIRDLAKQVIRAQVTVTGVQTKLSIDIAKIENTTRFTIVGLQGGYILKPQTAQYQHLPENEDVTMHLAEATGIAVVPHILVRLADGELAYLTRRIDRTGRGEKVAMEDLCQLSEQLTEYKYRGSHERIAKIIRRYSEAPGLDMVTFWTLVLFCWLTGNNDMHLKNFSLYRPQGMGYVLTPAYDLLNVAIVNPNDKEELALTLNGKKSKLTREDFEKAMMESGVDKKVVENIFRKFEKTYPKWKDIIRQSFLPDDMKEAYWKLIEERISRLQNA